MLGAACSILLAAGCKKKETVFELDTPGGGIKVEQDKKSGEVDITVEDK